MWFQFLIFLTMCCTKRHPRAARRRAAIATPRAELLALLPFIANASERDVCFRPLPHPLYPWLLSAGSSAGFKQQHAHWQRPVIHSVCKQKKHVGGWGGTPTSVPGARCPVKGVCSAPSVLARSSLFFHDGFLHGWLETCERCLLS